ncbi:hypothetical protein RZS08_14870, partial [Arthrospira platensis SPKY1]|nr:hypothetical protein [Arthrospira platensis SPKY1]
GNGAPTAGRRVRLAQQAAGQGRVRLGDARDLLEIGIVATALLENGEGHALGAGQFAIQRNVLELSHAVPGCPTRGRSAYLICSSPISPAR